MSGLELGMGDYMQVGPAARFVGPNAAQVIMRGPHGMRLAADPVKTREGRVRGSGFRFWSEQELPFLEKHQSWNPGQRVVGLMGLGEISGGFDRWATNTSNMLQDWLDSKEWTKQAQGVATRLERARLPIHRALEADAAGTLTAAQVNAADRGRQQVINIVNEEGLYSSDRSFANDYVNEMNKAANYLLDREVDMREKEDEFADIRRQVALQRSSRTSSATRSAAAQSAKATDPWWRSSPKEKARAGNRTTLGTDELKISLNTGGTGSGLSTPAMIGLAVVGTIAAAAGLKVLIGGRS